MIFDTSNPTQGKKFKDRANFLYKKGAKIEMVEKSPSRTIRQNKYFHLIIGWFSLDQGYEFEFTKQIIFKQWVNPDVFKSEFVNEKTGEVFEYWRSSAKITKKEMAECITKFRNYSAKNAGLYLPGDDEEGYLEEIGNQLEEYQNKIYL